MLATGIVVDDAIVVIENIERHMREYGKTALQAAIDAMREVFGAVIVIGIVLVAVFVPVAFFPGTTGRLYQQFSLTIAFAVVLSVFNAVTLTPALSALLLDKEAHTHGRFFTAVNRVIDGGTHGYVRVRPLRRCAGGGRCCSCFGLGLWATWADLAGRAGGVRAGGGRGLLHHHRAGAGRRVARVHDGIAKQAEKILFAEPEIAAAFSVMGFSFSGAAPNNGLMFARLKAYAERQRAEQSLEAVLEPRARRAVRHPRRDRACRSPPPAIQGLSRVRRLPVRGARSDRRRHRRPGRGHRRPWPAGNQSGRVAGLFSSFRANDPQLVVDIDRDKARASACRCAR